MAPVNLVTTATAFRERASEPHFGEGLPDASQALLQARIKDLKLHLSATPLERHIQQLYGELEVRGVSLRPQCYLSDQWGCPSGVPVIGIPFYLADPNLHSIEAELGGGAESERDIMMYLRHEAGHTFNYAYRLYETEEWQKLFGDYSAPYHDDFKPQPFSRKYVVHISGWYAQEHADEGIVKGEEEFMRAGLDWERRYKGWGALKKLQYVQSIVERLGRQAPEVVLEERDLDVDQMEETVLDHYRQRRLSERIDVQLGEHLDQDLMNLFEPSEIAPVPADTLVRAEKQAVIHAVTQYAGVSQGLVSSVLDHLLERTSALELTVYREKSRDYTTKLTSLVTALAMNYLYTDKFFEVD